VNGEMWEQEDLRGELKERTSGKRIPNAATPVSPLPSATHNEQEIEMVRKKEKLRKLGEGGPVRLTSGTRDAIQSKNGLHKGGELGDRGRNLRTRQTGPGGECGGRAGGRLS